MEWARLRRRGVGKNPWPWWGRPGDRGRYARPRTAARFRVRSRLPDRMRMGGLDRAGTMWQRAGQGRHDVALCRRGTEPARDA